MTEDVRRKRAERVRQQRVKNFFPKYRNYIIVGVLVLALVAAAVALAPTLPAAKKFAHVHPSMMMFINGEHVSFNHPDYDLGNIGATESHFHTRGGDPGSQAGTVMHIEASFTGGIPDISLERFLTAHGLTFRQGFLKLDTKGGHNGTEWPDQGGATWRVYVSKVTVDGRQPFERLTGDYSKYAPQDLEKILVTYGTDAFLTDEELARQQAMIPNPPGEPPASHTGG